MSMCKSYNLVDKFWLGCNSNWPQHASAVPCNVSWWSGTNNVRTYQISIFLKMKGNFHFVIIFVQLQTIVTGAGDETLRFWNVFPSMKAPVSMWPNFELCLLFSSIKVSPNSTICPMFHVVFFRPRLEIQDFGHWGAPKFDDPFDPLWIKRGGARRGKKVISIFFN